MARRRKTKPDEMQEEKPQEPEHWTVGRWHDRPQYCCKYCAFDTLDEASAQAHYDNVHAPPSPPPSPVQIPRYDRFGNPRLIS